MAASEVKNLNFLLTSESALHLSGFGDAHAGLCFSICLCVRDEYSTLKTGAGLNLKVHGGSNEVKNLNFLLTYESPL